MSSDLNGCKRRGGAGYRAQWELAGSLGLNPYATPGKPDNGVLYASFNNVVTYDGEVVTGRKAVVPDFFAATEQQLRDGKDLPGNFPKSLVEEALKAFDADRRDKAALQSTDSVVPFAKGRRGHALPEEPSRQMVAGNYDMGTHWGR